MWATQNATFNAADALVPVYQTPSTSKKHPEHKVYPYLLRKLPIAKPNQVWCVDITYIPMQRGPMQRGFLYLVAGSPTGR